MESDSVSRAGFEDLRLRLRDLVNARIRNGEYTERGLARLIGVSQPQFHNCLKGARNLSLDLADALLVTLGVSVLDLFTVEELHARTAVAPPRKALTWAAPSMKSQVG